jgi:hypothetical protein
MNLPAGTTIIVGQSFAHSLKSDPSFAAFSGVSEVVLCYRPHLAFGLARYDRESGFIGGNGLLQVVGRIASVPLTGADVRCGARPASLDARAAPP